MATYHIRVNPKNVPDDWRDDSLRRTAIHLNQAGKIPAVFSEDSLEYLRELPNLLMRQGVFIFAHEFIPQLALETISAGNSTDAKEMLDLQRIKEEAVNALQFEVAVTLLERQTQLRDRLAIRRPTITREQIVAVLARDGISIEDK